MGNKINHPEHYTKHPSGIECIQITEHMEFNLGNAVKYIWRADLKGKQIEDLKKATWYVQREISRIRRMEKSRNSVKGSTAVSKTAGLGSNPGRLVKKKINRGDLNKKEIPHGIKKTRREGGRERSSRL